MFVDFATQFDDLNGIVQLYNDFKKNVAEADAQKQDSRRLGGLDLLAKMRRLPITPEQLDAFFIGNGLRSGSEKATEMK